MTLFARAALCLRVSSQPSLHECPWSVQVLHLERRLMNFRAFLLLCHSENIGIGCIWRIWFSFLCAPCCFVPHMPIRVHCRYTLENFQAHFQAHFAAAEAILLNNATSETKQPDGEVRLLLLRAGGVSVGTPNPGCLVFVAAFCTALSLTISVCLLPLQGVVRSELVDENRGLSPGFLLRRMRSAQPQVYGKPQGEKGAVSPHPLSSKPVALGHNEAVHIVCNPKALRRRVWASAYLSSRARQPRLRKVRSCS